ncbi:prostate stem cell antigen [Latimeria chalumnae]|uniref:prostate stem cell antigen n=1 Tax=Latimeria chalumnae TaxID=7897 RepID=UPI0003C180D4|nr:PREDICTED: prostate stem cell antigen-like [Latimeria chalumnae]|eukprot:XP_006007251.1 PREDICTED: prostate stem cell antigen-like [Latimeria chalumnae]
MNKILLVVTVAFICLCIGEALQCKKCNFMVFNSFCLVSKTVNCSAGEKCGIITGSAVGKDVIKKTDCVDAKVCNTNSTAEYLGIKYTTSTTCCNTDLCNAAPALKVSAFSGILMLAACLLNTI